VRFVFCAFLFLAGCLDAGTAGVKKPDTPIPSTATVEGLTFEASRNREKFAADELDKLADKIKSGEVKYDKPLIDEIAAANDRASTAAGAKLSAAIGVLLNPGSTLDAAKAEKVVRELAAGRRRASK